MPRRWLVLTIEAPSADSAAVLAEGFFAFGVHAIEERAHAIVAWLADPGVEPELLVQQIQAALHEHSGSTPRIDWDWQPDQDWSEEWKRGLAPRRVGKRLIVAPSWTTPEPNSDDIVLTIDPQMAFGTGEHASTRGALRLLEPRVRPGMRVLDVGTGSAVLAIAAARLGATDVIGAELDEDALINARENVVANKVADKVMLEHRTVDSAYLASLGAFDVILANILSGVIIPLLPAFHSALRPEGVLVVAGILQAEADSFRSAANSRSFVVEQEDAEDEWWSACLRPLANTSAR